MATFDPETQFGPTPSVAGVVEEKGQIVLASGDDAGESFTIATKLHRIKGGFALLSDGTTGQVVAELCTTGLATFLRMGTINGDSPTVTYNIWGT